MNTVTKKKKKKVHGRCQTSIVIKSVHTKMDAIFLVSNAKTQCLWGWNEWSVLSYILEFYIALAFLESSLAVCTESKIFTCFNSLIQIFKTLNQEVFQNGK